jgi:hypothetical protein
MLIPSENEISRAGPLLAICRSQSIHYGSPDNPQPNIRHKEEQNIADFVENDSREVDHVTMFGRYPEPFQYDSVQPSLRNQNQNGPHAHKTNVEDHAPKQCLANLCDVHRGFSLMSKIRPYYYRLHRVAFATPQSGWTVGDHGTIMHTEDGGATWKLQSKGTFLSFCRLLLLRRSGPETAASQANAQLH